MSVFAPSSGLALQSTKGQNFRQLLSSHFINHVQVSTTPYAIPFLSMNISVGPFRVSARKLKPITASAASTVETSKISFRSKNPKDINVLVVGSTGYIGKFVVKELANRGFNVIAVARERSGIRGKNSKDDTLEQLNGTNVCFSDVTNLETLERSVEGLGVSIDVVVSCLASRNGGVKDSWNIDYEATKNSLVAGRKFGASHFVLLSAICVQKPLLEFQRAKLKFEAELMKEAEEDDGFTYSIVRPTAFFKSLGGQVELVKDGKPYVMFGDGKLCACKPISEQDLASFIADCVLKEDKINQVLPIGGPGKALTPLEQGEMLFKLVGKEPKFLKVPIEIMDFAIRFLDFLVKIFPSLEDAAEFGKIGRYYAGVESIDKNHKDNEREKPSLLVGPAFSGDIKVNTGAEVGNSEVEYMESEKLNDVKDVDTSLKTLLTELDSKDWVLVCEALNDVRRLSLFHKEAMVDMLENVISLIVKSLDNPRSAVCKTAIMASADIFKAYCDNIVDSIDPLLVQLLLKSSQDKRFVCEAAEKALIAMTTWVSPSLLLPKLQPNLKHRNPRIRAKASSCFSRSVPRLGVDGIKAYGIENLIQIAASQLSDQLPESREAARTLLLELQNIYEKALNVTPTTVSEDPETISWKHFCQSKLSPLSAQAVLRVTNLTREGIVLGS